MENAILIFLVIDLHNERRTQYIQSMSIVQFDLQLSDLRLNQHKKGNGTPEYFISEASGILWANPKYGWQTIATALGNAEYYIDYPQKISQKQIVSAEKFIHTTAKELKGTTSKKRGCCLFKSSICI